MTNAERYARRSIRLAEYDYSQPGSYFVTITCQDRTPVLGNVSQSAMTLSQLGKIVKREWQRSIEMRKEIVLDTFVVMPNHVHGIVTIIDESPGVGAHGRAPLQERTEDGRTSLHRPPRSLGSFVAAFKAASTKRINTLRGTPGERFWQRNYYERVVRNERELLAVREYIDNNPATWPKDIENPAVATSVTR